MKKILLPFIAASLALGFAHNASAEIILYDNANPNDSPNSFNGSEAAWDITDYTVTDTFVLSGPATVSDINFWAWTFQGDTTSSVDWSITNLAGDTTYGAGTADVNNTDFELTNNDGYDVNEVNFTTGTINLPTGSYDLSLENASTSDQLFSYWDENDGPSSATSSYQSGPIGSESFQILGSPTPTPEPSGLVVLETATLFIVLFTVRRRCVSTEPPKP